MTWRCQKPSIATPRLPRTAYAVRTYQHLTRGELVLPALTSNDAGKLLAIRKGELFINDELRFVYWGEQMAPSADTLADAVRIEQVEEVFNGAVKLDRGLELRNPAALVLIRETDYTVDEASDEGHEGHILTRMESGLESGTGIVARLLAYAPLFGETSWSDFGARLDRLPPISWRPVLQLADCLSEAASVRLSWKAPVDNPTGYEIQQRWIREGKESCFDSIMTKAPIDVASTDDSGSLPCTVIVEGLVPGAMYDFRVVVLSGHGTPTSQKGSAKSQAGQVSRRAQKGGFLARMFGTCSSKNAHSDLTEEISESAAISVSNTSDPSVRLLIPKVAAYDRLLVTPRKAPRKKQTRL